MPAIKIGHVVSFSSEDSSFPAENLTLRDSYKKWKCKSPGEKQATVILQLDKASIISSIDIGNEHSAFVEVLVGRSGASSEEFKVLVVTSSFMTPLESKTSASTNRIRIFKEDELTKPTCHEKWDRVKVVCSQPFNKSVQYGLSFIRLNTPEEKEETLGRFAMREEDEIIPVGKLFAKRKEIQEEPLKGAAAIRDASTPAGVMRNNLNPPVNLTDSLKAMADKRTAPSTSTSPFPQKKRAAPSTSTADTPPREKKRKPSEKKKPSDNVSDDGKKPTPRTNDRPKTNRPPPPTKKKTPKASHRRKPFGKLLEGVVFVLSGYQNPARQNYRDKATEMGARYKPDWDPTCTHLICAFVNTPKFQQVKGKGKIVTKQWLEDCYSERKRLPWRRYALDRNDQGKDESEDEILEDVPTPTVRGGSVERIKETVTKPLSDSGSDTEDEIERFKLKQAQEAERKKAPENGTEVKKPVKNGPTLESKVTAGPSADDSDDTDIDDDENDREDTSSLPLPFLPDFFEDKTFYLHDELPDEAKTELKRYIVAFKGTVSDDLDNTPIDYFLANDDIANIKQVLTEHPDLVAVTPAWVWKCNDAEKMLSVTPYLIS